jgi:two-component system, OmpR family, phosphate regulon sensor histidine kinase PhoR
MFPAVERPLGRPLVEVVRDHRIEAAAAGARESRLEQAIEVELPVSGRILQVRALPQESGGVLLLAQDVTRLRYLETVRQQFVANLSHELRTPLAGLDLAAQTLAGQLPSDGDTRAFIDRVVQESQRLQGILLNLTQLAALDAEGIQPERAAFSVAQLVNELVQRFRPEASSSGLSLRAELDEGGAHALGDRGKTDQVLQNIIDNALKFAGSGEVLLTTRLDGTRVEIAVRDQGPGIPARDLPRVFERFYKVGQLRAGKPGSGLGLSIARHLIELQGGTITAESVPGQGTTVRVRLPRAP